MYTIHSHLSLRGITSGASLKAKNEAISTFLKLRFKASGI